MAKGKISLFGLLLCLFSTGLWAEQSTVQECEPTDREQRWFDQAQRFFSSQFCQPASWFDSFFADDRAQESYQADTHARLQNDLTYTFGEGFDYTAELSASLKLPRAKQRIKLEFAGEQEDSLTDLVPTDETQTRSSIGLFYELFQSPRADINLRVKLNPSIRLNYHYRYPLSDSFATRVTQELFNVDGDVGLLSRLDFEKDFANGYLLRQSNSLKSADSINGQEWVVVLQLYQFVDPQSAFSYEWSRTGKTRPIDFVDSERLGVRYRQNFLRKWLFYEISPAARWQQEKAEDERERFNEILFRLEVNFKTSETN